MSFPAKTCCAISLLVSLSPVAAPCPQAPAAASQCAADQPRSAVTVSFEPSQSLVRSTVQVAAHQSLQYNFPLTSGSTVVARFQVSGGVNNSIKVWLLDSANFQLYEAHQRFSYYQGTAGAIRSTAHYIFRVPQNNIYYLVLDNSGAWLLPRTVNLYVYDLLPTKPPETLALEK